jgi:mono/diheme cytochrome c family protein
MNTATTPRKLMMTTLAAAMLAACTVAYAAEPERFDVGKYEYEASCAVCHGAKGKGDGPMRGQLVTPVPDITTLAKRNNGVFPFSRVYDVIDGREKLAAHGTREMPVWGRIYSRQTSIFYEPYPSFDPESAVRSRIMALAEYVYRLQGK